jgi:energy-coupling factor transport system permease protein
MDLLRSLPVGLYLEKPQTWLHRVDPRVKLAWLTTLLTTPIWANAGWRLGLVGLLFALTLLAWIPFRVWRQQLGWLLVLCLLGFCITAFLGDGLNFSYQPRLPADELKFLEQVPPIPPIARWYQIFWVWQWQFSLDGAIATLSHHYHYVLGKIGPFEANRWSFQLAVRTATWLFTLIYGTNLFLLTTAPEAIAATLEYLLQPLKRWRLPVVEVGLTLTLSLRFIPLVLEEIQNLIRSVRTRAIPWRKLGPRGIGRLGLMLVDRLIENLFLRAEQIASAMTVRGFTSPNHHQVQWHQFQLRRWDWLGWLLLLAVWIARISLGQYSE